MGNKLFGVDIAKIVNQAMGAGLLPATITSVVSGTRGTPTQAGRQKTETTHTCRAILETFDEMRSNGTIIARRADRILILGDSINPAVVPKQNDKVTIEGKTYVISDDIIRDPAAATYSCGIA